MQTTTKRIVFLLLFILALITPNSGDSRTYLMDGGLTAAIIGGAAALASTGGQAYAQGKSNKKTRRWNEQMYARQLADNKDLWHMQNQYNSPQEQMQRLKDAGLNPHLVYGNGSAVNTASPVQQGRMGDWRPETPNISAMGGAVQDGLKSYYDVRQSDISATNQRRQGIILNQKINDNTLDVNSKLAKIQGMRLDNSVKERMTNLTIDQAAENLRRTQLQNALDLTADERAAVTHANSNQQAALNILMGRKSMAKTDKEMSYIDQQIKNLQNDAEIQKYDIQNAKQGIAPNADYVAKYLATKYPGMLNGYMIMDKGIDLGTKALGALRGFGKPKDYTEYTENWSEKGGSSSTMKQRQYKNFKK